MKRKFDVCKKCSCFVRLKPIYVNNGPDRGKEEVFVCGKMQWNPNVLLNMCQVKDESTGETKWGRYEASRDVYWNALDLPKKCELYAEYCMEEWNEHEKKA